MQINFTALFHGSDTVSSLLSIAKQCAVVHSNREHDIDFVSVLYLNSSLINIISRIPFAVESCA